MAVSSNRSPSPIPPKPKPNPNSRTPETNSTMRRSFSGNPLPRPSIHTNPTSFTPDSPANSPSDFGRRLFTGKVGGIEKEIENDKNLKPAKARSPAIAKGSKNFMTPTISAASKINASPRKKALAERNEPEPVRTSILFSDDGKGSFGSVNFSDVTEDNDLKLEMGLNQNKIEDSNDFAITKSDHKEAVLEIHSISKASKRDTALISQVPQNTSESLSEMKRVESNCISAGTSSKNKPSGSLISTIISPLDADPSLLPPYDPKTTYLSPRPRFLHYKPNPRIKVYLHKEKGLGVGEGKQLEESFMSESFSDTEVTEETESENSQKESEDDSSAEMLNEEEEPHVYEPNLSSIPISYKKNVEAKRLLKPQFFTRSKYIVLLLVFLIGCLSIPITDSPPAFDSSVDKDLSISKFDYPSEIAEFAKASFDGLAINFRQWSANSVCYLSKLIRILDESNKWGPLQFSNLTYLQEARFIDEYLEVDHSEEIHEQDELEPVEEGGEVETKPLEEKRGDLSVEAVDNSEEALQGHCDPEIEEHLSLEVDVIEPDSSEVVHNEELSDTALLIAAGVQSDIGLEDQLVLTSKAPGFKHEVEVHKFNPEVIEPDSSEVVHNEEQSDTALLIAAGIQSDIGLEDQLVLTSKAPEFKHEVEVHKFNPEVIEPDSSEVVQYDEQSDTALHIAANEQSSVGFEDQSVLTSRAPEFKYEVKVREVNPEVIELDSSEAVQNDEQSDTALQITVSARSNKGFEDHSVLTSRASEFKSEVEVHEVNPEVVGNDLNSGTKIKSTIEANPETSLEMDAYFGDVQSSVAAESSLNVFEDKFSGHHMPAIALLALALVTAAAFINLKQGRTTTPSAAIPVNPLLSEKLTYSTLSVSTEHSNQERLSSQIWSTEVDIDGEESCPSEMSSFQKSLFYSKKGLRVTNEVQSQERKERKNSKRESLASSSSEYSMGSSSYGSFTTYKKIPSKHGCCGDEEIVMPVRCSSRIRNQVTSP